MEHRRYSPFTGADDPTLHFHSTIIPTSVEVPVYMQQVPHDTTTVFSPPPPPETARWNSGGMTPNYSQTTTIRWPRQETLTLLEVRSRLDHCFKEATSSNHKAPLWDEISRIMKEEYGYQRSGRKCKEKFENLHKYYKKTKEGKVGKADGKHYRFFRQLEALSGNQHDLPGSTINAHTAGYPSSQSNHSFENNITNDNDDFKRKELIAAIEESIESQFMKLIVKQEQWCDKILCTIEQNEQERVVIEEQRRTQEAVRLDQEYAAWASHVAKIKTRDESLLEALQNLIRVRSGGSSHKNINPMENLKESEYSCDLNRCKDWIEPEISSLIRIRSDKECKFQEAGQEHEGRLWEEVAFELSLLGYNRSDKVCKETWDKLYVDFNKRKMECENKINKEVCLETSNEMNIDCRSSWEPM